MLIGRAERLLEIRLGQPLHRQTHANDPLRLLHRRQRRAFAQAQAGRAVTFEQEHAVAAGESERQAALRRGLEQLGQFVHIRFGHRATPAGCAATVCRCAETLQTTKAARAL
ncbi:hypothetical protein D3C77_542920 [compost metagenome]